MCKKCGNNTTIIVYSNAKIKRYMLACSICGSHIKWIPNKEMTANVDVKTYTEEYRQNIRKEYGRH